jgi:YegS/Rv2252/BmrU family lipid kinase
MRLYFIFNPYAGKGILKTKLFSIIKIFSSAGYAVEVFPTEQKGDATAKAFEICNAPCAYDLIVCAGGDGTLNEVLQGIMQSDRKIPVGYIPTGTSNDFARSIGIPFQVEKAAELAVTGRPFQNDIGQFNDNFFTYLAAFGAFANVSYDASQAMKNNLGYIAYFLEALKCIKEIKGYKISIEYDDGRID